MELFSMLCGSLDGRGTWGRMDTYVCMAESLCCPPETITTLLISYTPTQNSKLKKKKSTVSLCMMASSFGVLTSSQCMVFFTVLKDESLPIFVAPYLVYTWEILNALETLSNV